MLNKLFTVLSALLLVSCTPKYDLEKDYCGGIVVEVERNSFSYTGYEFTIILDSTYYYINLPEHYNKIYGIGDRLCEESWHSVKGLCPREKEIKRVETERVEFEAILKTYK